MTGISARANPGSGGAHVAPLAHGDGYVYVLVPSLPLSISVIFPHITGSPSIGSDSTIVTEVGQWVPS
jgi:hypothetical protein